MTTPPFAVAVINGPNLNLLGSREPAVYGTKSLADLEGDLARWASERKISIDFLQTNHEGVIIDAIHDAAGLDGIVLNPGAFAHTSRAIADAIGSVDTPVVEVHISNIRQREPWRAVSVLEDVVTRSIFGRGVTGYKDALRFLINLRVPATTVAYGPHPENVGDLRVPNGADSVVMLVHGGFWLQEWGRDTMDSLAVALHDLGVATWNVEYRRSGAGGPWPGSIEDARLALGHLQRRTPLTGAPVRLLGHSAGGYLALALSDEADVAGTTVLAPISDLELLRESVGPGDRIALQLLQSGAPARVNGRGVHSIHGLADDLVTHQQSQRLTGAVVELLADIGHFELLDPAQSPWASVRKSLLPKG